LKLKLVVILVESGIGALLRGLYKKVNEPQDHSKETDNKRGEKKTKRGRERVTRKGEAKGLTAPAIAPSKKRKGGEWNLVN